MHPRHVVFAHSVKWTVYYRCQVADRILKAIAGDSAERGIKRSLDSGCIAGAANTYYVRLDQEGKLSSLIPMHDQNQVHMVRSLIPATYPEGHNPDDFVAYIRAIPPMLLNQSAPSSSSEEPLQQPQHPSAVGDSGEVQGPQATNTVTLPCSDSQRMSTPIDQAQAGSSIQGPPPGEFQEMDCSSGISSQQSTVSEASVASVVDLPSFEEFVTGLATANSEMNETGTQWAQFFDDLESFMDSDNPELGDIEASVNPADLTEPAESYLNL